MQVAEGKPQGLPELVKRDLGSWFFPLGFTREGSFYYGVMTEMDELYFATLNPVTGKLQGPPTLVSHVGGWSSADWSPDGQRLAYVLRRGPIGTGYVAYSWALVVRYAETGQEREIPLALSRNKAFQPRWSPDGRALLAAGNDPKGRQGIYLVDVQTGELNPVVQEKHRGDIRRFDAAVWSSDGKAIFYRWSNNVPPGGVAKILTRNLKSGNEKELLGAVWPAFLGSLAVSPDGRWLGFISGIDTPEHGPASMALKRSEERRVGKECRL